MTSKTHIHKKIHAAVGLTHTESTLGTSASTGTRALAASLRRVRFFQIQAAASQWQTQNNYQNHIVTPTWHVLRGLGHAVASQDTSATFYTVEPVLRLCRDEASPGPSSKAP